MFKRPQESSVPGRNASSARLPGPGRPRRRHDRRRHVRAGQAYTEYLLILLFGVLVCLGVVAIDQQQETRIMERLYGYMFDYYAGMANYLSLPIF